VVLSRRPGLVGDVLRVDRPLATRDIADPDLMALEKRLWRMIRDDAAVAERERIDAPA
jgi:NitT/TauT family transport system ATP-binding protein